MKKFLYMFLCLVVLFAVSSCGDDATVTGGNEGTEDNPTEIIDDSYTVKVCYPDGSGAADVAVQWCTIENCFLPQYTDGEGVAKYASLADGEYFVHIDEIPEGYTYNPNIYTTTPDNKSIVVELISLSSFTGGDGSMANPYVSSKGTYVLNISATGNNAAVFISFTPETSGSYTIESLATDKLAANPMDPIIFDFGCDGATSPSAQGNDGGAGENFAYTVDLEAGKTYVFAVALLEAAKVPANLAIQIR